MGCSGLVTSPLLQHSVTAGKLSRLHSPRAQMRQLASRSMKKSRRCQCKAAIQGASKELPCFFIDSHSTGEVILLAGQSTDATTHLHRVRNASHLGTVDFAGVQLQN